MPDSPIFHYLLTLLKKNTHPHQPLLLALSGGPDSLFLLMVLIRFREQTKTPIHIAHVNHNWREESTNEASLIEKLAQFYQVPFHLYELNPSLATGNLEAYCRHERYLYFSKLYHEIGGQALLTGHHADDLAETVLKRLFEGAHLTKLHNLTFETNLYQMRVLRPLISISKEVIYQELLNHSHLAFEDPTNYQTDFLRARIRQTVLPWLTQQFGKNIRSNLIALAEDSLELDAYFKRRLIHLLENWQNGPWGRWIHLQETLPKEKFEIHALIRLFSTQLEQPLSREQIKTIVDLLVDNKANKQIFFKNNFIGIDRQRFFYLNQPEGFKCEKLTLGAVQRGQWSILVEEAIYEPTLIKKGWDQGLKGELVEFLSNDKDYFIGFAQDFFHGQSLKKRWSLCRVPAFLYSFFPFIWHQENVEVEFLTSHLLTKLKFKQPCWKITLRYLNLTIF